MRKFKVYPSKIYATSSYDHKLKLQEIARNCSPTADKLYNEGRQDVLNGNIYSKAAKYFLECENLK